MNRDQFTFYRSYYEALKTLPPKDFKAAVLAVCAYALDEEIPTLTGIPNSVFVLIRPTLDSGRIKAANRMNKRKTKEEQSKNKQEQNRKEGEKEREGEGELEREGEKDTYTPKPPSVAAVYLDRVNPEASQQSLEEISAFESAMGREVCVRAIDIALDNKKANWAYIRAILRRWSAEGIKCLADIDAAEARRDAEKEGKRGTGNNAAGAGGAHPAESRWSLNSDLDLPG